VGKRLLGSCELGQGQGGAELGWVAIGGRSLSGDLVAANEPLTSRFLSLRSASIVQIAT